MNHEVSGPWLVRKPHGRTRARLFCFPYAGGGASAYRLWRADLPAELEVCAVQLPGHESRLREPPYSHLDAMVEALVPALLTYLDLPFALFGHSMGAAVATEVTMALSRRGGPMPEHLFVSGHRAPHLPDPEPPLAGLSDSDFVLEIDRRYSAIPAEVLQDREVMELLLPGLRADIAALEAYHPASAPRIECPLSVFGGTEDSRVSREHLEAWSESAAKEFRVRQFQGGHFYLTPRRAEVLADVAATLAPLLHPARMTMPASFREATE